MPTISRKVGRPARSAHAVPGSALPSVLRTLRNGAGLSRQDAADRAGLSINTLAALEQGKISDPGFFKVVRATQVYEISLDELVSAVRERASRDAVHVKSRTGKGQPMSNGVISAGYEGRTIDGFVESLVSVGVTAVADVRLNAISRKAGFSKGKLRAALEGVGIEYLHFRTLGNPKTNREPFWSGRLGEGRAVYRELLAGDEQVSALSALGDLARDQVVAVLCFEEDHDRCHRQVVIAEVTQGRDVAVQHLPRQS